VTDGDLVGRYPQGYASTVPDTCPECGGAMEPTVLSGIVSLKRKRGMLASGRVSAIDARTCVRCGRTELRAAEPRRLFPEQYTSSGG
jgi:rRNA maturation protein Nop10